MHRHRLILAVAPLLATPAFAGEVGGEVETASVRATNACTPGKAVAGYRSAKPADTHKLGTLPPAVEIKALYRRVGQCVDPIVIADSVGANKGAARLPVGGDAIRRPLR